LAAILATLYDYETDLGQPKNKDTSTMSSLSSKYLRYSNKNMEEEDDGNPKQQEEEKLNTDPQRKQRYDMACQILTSSRELLLLPPEPQQPALEGSLEALLQPSTSTSNSTSEEDSKALLHSYVNQLSPGAGFPCVSLWLFQYLLSNPPNGYDARMRHVMKKLAVAVFLHDTKNADNGADHETLDDDSTMIDQATRRFEALERAVARRLITLAEMDQKKRGAASSNDNESTSNKSGGLSRRQVVRGLKVGAMGVVAGTLFVVTAGMAAPGIALALTGLLGTGVAGVFLTLASTTAVTALFGVAGGSLAAYKMNRRTAGLTEFTFQRQDNRASSSTNETQSSGDPKHQDTNDKATTPTPPSPELCRTICISGWLVDECDFQRPWGVLVPWDPPLTNKLELLQRFYAIHNPPLVVNAEAILKKWEGREDQFWNLLKETYGQNANDDNVPLSMLGRENRTYELSTEEEALMNHLIAEVGKIRSSSTTVDDNDNQNSKGEKTDGDASKSLTSVVGGKEKNETLEKVKAGGSRFGKGFKAGFGKLSNQAKKAATTTKNKYSSSSEPTEEQLQQEPQKEEAIAESDVPAHDTTKSQTQSAPEPSSGPSKNRVGKFKSGAGRLFSSKTQTNTSTTTTTAPEEPLVTDFERVSLAEAEETSSNSTPPPTPTPPEHLATLWNFGSRYAGEMYTVRWESELLQELCDSVKDLAYEMASNAGKEVLKKTAAATLLIAMALPTAVYKASNMIDGTWTLAIERCDAAGKELARSLLFSEAGHRPVTLVGYSFGGRVIYSCLGELARYQKLWEKQQQEPVSASDGKKETKGKTSSKSTARVTSATVSEMGQEGVTEEELLEQQQEEDEASIPVEPASIVEDAILIGTPIHMNPLAWSTCRAIVSGRLVNVYSRKDRMLTYMFQYKHLKGALKPVCGTCTVPVPGVENVDVTDLVSRHLEYRVRVSDILERICHGQPKRLPSNAVDEVALLVEAEEELELQEEQQTDKEQTSS
jgi:hypothetical protein